MAKAAGRPKGSRNNKSKNTTSDDNNASDEALVNDAISRAISSNDTDSVISSLVDGDEARMILETASTSNSAGITVVDLVDLSSQTAICSQIVKGRIEEDTRKGYERTLRFIVGICDVLCPLAIDKDTKQLRLPMKLCDLVAFLGEVAKERENKSVRAVSTITGYITAIKHAHTEASNFVYNCIISIALANDKLRGTHDELEKITRMEWDRVFADAFVLLIEQISIVGKTIKKPGEISYVSLYDYCKELYNLYMIDADGESSSIANGNDSVTDEATSEG